MKSLSTKKIIIAILSVLFAFCMIAGLTANKASANTNLETVTLKTTMNQSAQMRLTNPTGMRFITIVDEDDVDLFGDDIQVVTMITQKNLLDEKGISVEDFDKDTDVKKAEVVFDAGNFQAAKDAHNGAIKLTATILEISDKNIAKTYVAKTYITDGEKIGYVEGATEASIYDVATEALKNVNPADEPEAYEVLLGYTKSCNIVINDNAEEPVEVPYGSKLIDTIFYGMPECFTVVSIKDANGGDVAKDFVVTEDIALTIELAENHKWVDGECEFNCGAKCYHPEYENGACVECGTVCEHDSYTDGVCDTCETACAHTAWTDGVCDTCATVCTHEFVDGVCGTCGFVKVVRPYDIADLDPAYTATYNEDGSISISGSELATVDYQQVINGKFKANATYIITISASFVGASNWGYRVVPHFDGYDSAGDFIWYEATVYEMEYTVGEEDVDSIVIYTRLRFYNGSIAEEDFTITLKATAEEKISLPYMIKITNTMEGAAVAYNEDGSSTVSAPSFNSSGFRFDHIFNGTFKANTTYEISFNTAWTGSNAWKIVSYLDPDETDGKYGTSSTMWGSAYLNQTGNPSRTYKYTVGDADVNQIVITSWTRCVVGGKDVTDENPFSITFSAEIKEIYPFEVTATGNATYDLDDTVITYTTDAAELPSGATSGWKISTESYDNAAFRVKLVFKGEFKANTTYVITLKSKYITQGCVANLYINTVVNQPGNRMTGSDIQPSACTSANGYAYEYTVGDADVTQINLFSWLRASGDTSNSAAFSMVYSATIAEKVA